MISTFSGKPIFGYIGMVYAMFSIGILGFIVWSQMVGLLHSDMEVINIAICWNGFTSKGTLYSNNLFRYTQPAGNLYTKSLKSSSETIRETSHNFDLYFKI